MAHRSAVLQAKLRIRMMVRCAKEAQKLSARCMEVTAPDVYIIETLVLTLRVLQVHSAFAQPRLHLQASIISLLL